jgi:hypothetical protein
MQELNQPEVVEAKDPPKPKPKRKRNPSKPKTEDLSGLGVAGNPEKYKEAHENKYAPKEKIGKPTLGRSPAFVEKVGLGGLKVIHNGSDPGSYS